MDPPCLVSTIQAAATGVMVFYDCLHNKIKLFPQLAKPFTRGAKHKARFAQL